MKFELVAGERFFLREEARGQQGSGVEELRGKVAGKMAWQRDGLGSQLSGASGILRGNALPGLFSESPGRPGRPFRKTSQTAQPPLRHGDGRAMSQSRATQSGSQPAGHRASQTPECQPNARPPEDQIGQTPDTLT